MKFTPTEIPGVLVIQPDVLRDERGFFFESYHREKYANGGVSTAFVQDNHSHSVKGTLRGLHLQMERPQAKLVRVLAGEVFDVAVDLRQSSPTFKKWVGVTLSGGNFTQLYVPQGCAHGFVTLSEWADVEYKCSDFYEKTDEAGVLWNDPEIGISWPVPRPLLSAKDLAWPSFRDLTERLRRCPAYRA